MTKISIIGAGAWGTAMAQTFATAGHDVMLYARDANLAETINTRHENTLYLPNKILNEKIHATGDLVKSIDHAEMIILATPTQYIRAMLETIKPFLRSHVPLINAAKGIEISTGKLLSEVAAEVLPRNPYGVLSGPSFAHEVAQGLPTAVTLATSASDATENKWAEILSGKNFRPYLSHDTMGAEMAGALKNVIAIACGIVEGKALGQNAKAAVMTRGLAEIKRLGLAKGAEAESFLGLAGVGDLILTCSSQSSRNYSLGVALGQGRLLKDILAERRSVAEGVTTAKAVCKLATALNIEMPICFAVNGILHQGENIDGIIASLLSRKLKHEGE
jgi:glycerol-3-phosphate dehydrogenase (NAD(P)+)